MATIAPIGMLGNQNKFMCKVFWLVVLGRKFLIFVFAKKAVDELWEVMLSETFIGQGNRNNRSLTRGIDSLIMRTLGDKFGCRVLHFTMKSTFT
jgi:hypothetical protein